MLIVIYVRSVSIHFLIICLALDAVTANYRQPNTNSPLFLTLNKIRLSKLLLPLTRVERNTNSET